MYQLQYGGFVMMSPTQIKEYFNSKNMKPSYPRIKIFEYLINNLTHPTVDEIYLSLVNEIPTLSKTTVYNTLKLFVDHNLATLVSIEDIETRYDVAVHNHGHFKCNNCGNIYDFAVDIDHIHVDDLNGFLIHEKQINLKGICRNCQ